MTEEIHTGHTVDIQGNYDRYYGSYDKSYQQRRFLFRPEVTQADRQRIIRAEWNGDHLKRSTIVWNDPDDNYFARKAIGGGTAAASVIWWFARLLAHVDAEDTQSKELPWEWGQILGVQLAMIALATVLALRRTSTDRNQKRVQQLHDKGMFTAAITHKERNAPTLMKAGKAIFDTRAYREGWVDQPKVRMIVEEEIWRINERRGQLQGLENENLTEAQRQSAEHIARKLEDRMLALARYNNALLDIDTRLAEADLLKDRETRNGTLVNLLAELEGDQAIALTETLTQEAKAVQKAIAKAIEQAKQAATEIHNLHQPKEVSA